MRAIIIASTLAIAACSNANAPQVGAAMGRIAGIALGVPLGGHIGRAAGSVAHAEGAEPAASE